MAFVGFTADDVTNSIDNVVKAYESLYTELCDNFQTKFVKEISTGWFAKEAVDAMKVVESNEESLLKAVNESFSYVVDIMNAGAKNWATNLGDASVFNSVTFNARGTDIDVSSVKENDAGRRGVDMSIVNTAVTNLKTVGSNAKDATKAAKDAVQTSEKNGFIGGGQSAALEAKLNEIMTKIDNSLDEIQNDIASAAKAVETKYGQIEADNTSGFGGN